jgi:uncharacterized protein (TIGR02679 family)
MANYSDADPLTARFQQPDLRRVLGGLANRLRHGRSLAGRLRIRNPSVEEQHAVAALLGSACRRPEGRSLSVDLAALEVLATRDGRFSSLRQLVESACGGPINDQRARRTAEEARWNELWQAASQWCGESEPLRRWIDELRSGGAVRRRFAGNPSAASRLLDDVFRVLGLLPQSPPIALARLAADVFGDSHALDADRDCGRLAVRGAAVLAGHERPRSAAAMRSAWLAAGVAPDDLSATVLVLNLPACPDTPLGQVLAIHREQGEPCRITSRQLRQAQGWRLRHDAGTSIFVCENPSVMAAAADRWGVRSRPLICVEGQPNLAVEQALLVARSQGFQLRYHGDFDWGGLRIASRLWRQVGFLPWRFDVHHYCAAPTGRRLTGSPHDAPWDPSLREAMESRGCAVHEEAVLAELLDDLCQD